MRPCCTPFRRHGCNGDGSHGAANGLEHEGEDVAGAEDPEVEGGRYGRGMVTGVED